VRKKGRERERAREVRGKWQEVKEVKEVKEVRA
jgi:hypothetical protein